MEKQRIERQGSGLICGGTYISGFFEGYTDEDFLKWARETMTDNEYVYLNGELLNEEILNDMEKQIDDNTCALPAENNTYLQEVAGRIAGLNEPICLDDIDDFYDKEEDEHDLVQYGYDSKITIDINDEQVEISISFDGGSSGDSIDPIPLQEFCDKLGLIKKEENK